MPPTSELDRARTLVLRYGWNATAYQILNPGIRLWLSADAEAVVGHVDREGVRVVAGAPVCPPGRLPQVVAEFETDAAAASRRVCYFAAGHRLHAVLGDRPTHSSLLVGAQPAWPPSAWPAMLDSHASLRQQLNRARNKGVSVAAWPAARAAGDQALHRCLDRWLAGRGLPPMHFLVEPEILSDLDDRMVFVAERDAEVVAFLIASPVPMRTGWLIEQIVRSPGAPNGTAELLIDAAVRAMAHRGDGYVTLGLAPLSRRAGAPAAQGSPWIRLILGWTRAHARRFYDFEGLEAFKAKFRPSTWEPIYLIADEPRVTLRYLRAVAGAFSGRSMAATVAGALAKAARQEARWLMAPR